MRNGHLPGVEHGVERGQVSLLARRRDVTISERVRGTHTASFCATQPARDIHHLTPVITVACHLMHVSLALLANLHPLHNHLIGQGRNAQALARGGPSWLFAAWLAQTHVLVVYGLIRGRPQMPVKALMDMAICPCPMQEQTAKDQRCRGARGTNTTSGSVGDVENVS
jgi:hypothetical protein